MRMKALIFSALALATTAPALANDLVVNYADLDLSSAKDRKILDRRIDAASRAYCGADRVATGSRIRRSESTKCAETARNLAREQLKVVMEQQSRTVG